VRAAAGWAAAKPGAATRSTPLRAAGGRALRAPAPPAQEQAKGEPDSTHKTN